MTGWPGDEGPSGGGGRVSLTQRNIYAARRAPVQLIDKLANTRASMDYLNFLRIRLAFTREFYDDACRPFIERRRRIEAFEVPYEEPPGCDDGEPPFLDEWIRAGDALDCLGQAALCMLATSLHLYLREWSKELRERAGDDQLQEHGVGLPDDDKYRAASKKGWINKYREYCAALGIEWHAGPSDLTMLEDVVLGRNVIQHTEDITSIRARQLNTTLRGRSSFFADPLEEALLAERPNMQLVRGLRLEIGRDRLLAAIDEVEAFCSWLDAQHPLGR